MLPAGILWFLEYNVNVNCPGASGMEHSGPFSKEAVRDSKFINAGGNEGDFRGENGIE